MSQAKTASLLEVAHDLGFPYETEEELFEAAENLSAYLQVLRELGKLDCLVPLDREGVGSPSLN